MGEIRKHVDQILQNHKDLAAKIWEWWDGEPPEKPKSDDVLVGYFYARRTPDTAPTGEVDIDGLACKLATAAKEIHPVATNVCVDWAEVFRELLDAALTAAADGCEHPEEHLTRDRDGGTQCRLCGEILS